MDFAAGEISLYPAIVFQHVSDALKTETSRKAVPLDAGLSAFLLDWRGRSPYNQSTGFVCAAAEKKGREPLWSSSAVSQHIRPATQRARIRKHAR